MTLSSLNVLSSSVKTSTTTFGIRFQDRESATFLEGLLLRLAPRDFSLKDRLAILSAIANGESTINAEAEKHGIETEIIEGWRASLEM